MLTFARIGNLTRVLSPLFSLSALPSELFWSVQRLQVLELEDNIFGRVPSNAFASLGHLTELNLADNSDINGIGASDFGHLGEGAFFPAAFHFSQKPVFADKLRHLNLRGCSVSGFQRGSMDHLRNLHSLDISDNSLASVPEEALRHAPSRSHLNSFGKSFRCRPNNFPCSRTLGLSPNSRRSTWA